LSKIILTVATTGAWISKEANPHVPITPEEIAEEVYACWKAGASMAHIHVRDNEGKAAMDFDNFEKTVKMVRERCDIVINLTTSGGLGLKEEDRIKPFFELRPEVASYDAGSMNWGHNDVFLNSPNFLEKLGKTMQECNVKPELEIFDSGMVYNTLYYLEKDILPNPPHYQFVLGVPGGMSATVENLVFLKSLIPSNATWSAFGIGRMHLPIMYAALALGGHIRVGMEDNIYYTKGVLAESNVDFVKRAVRIINEFNSEVASPDEARQILGLSK